MKYTIGLDLGIASVGWAVINQEVNELVDYGVRLFPESKGAADRRIIRGSRRRRKRQKTRELDLQKKFDQIEFPNSKTFDSKLIYTRCKAIKEQIEKQDIVNILLYFNANRGYIPFDSEKEEMEEIELNESLPCEFYCKQYEMLGKYHALNKIVLLKDNIRELEQMLAVQTRYYPEITKEWKTELLQILTRKREFWEGPGGGVNNTLTPYGRFQNQEDIEQYQLEKARNPEYETYLFTDLIGNCEIAIHEKRAPKLNYYAEKFNFINDCLNLSFISADDMNEDYIFLDNGKYRLNHAGIAALESHILNSKKVSLEQMFKKVLYTTLENIDGIRTDSKFKKEINKFDLYRSLSNLFLTNSRPTDWLGDLDCYNKIAYYITVTPGKISLQDLIKNDPDIPYMFEDEDYKLMIQFKTSQEKQRALSYHSLSETVLKRAIEDMLKYNCNFSSVRKLLKYDEEAHNYFIQNYKKGSLQKDELLLENYLIDDIIASPQVKRTLRQAIKVVNEIIKKYNCLPTVIAVESTHELNGDERRKEIERTQKKQAIYREESAKLLQEHGQTVNRDNIEKVMLFLEINGHCPYCSRLITFEDLFQGNAEVEHIIPISVSFDNSFDNKTISCVKCNAVKLNLTPYQFLKENFEHFKKQISSSKFSDQKKRNFIDQGSHSKYQKKFISRNLRDTAYATKEMIHQIKLFNLYLKGKLDLDQIQTISTPGQLTSRLREKYNLKKDRKTSFHHAVDAAIIASIPSTSIGKTILESQNNPKFWLDSENKLKGKEPELEFISLTKVLPQIQKINENTKISKQIRKNCQQAIFPAAVSKIIQKEDKYYKINKLKNIYQIDFSNKLKDPKILFDKLFDDNNTTATLLCYDKDPVLYHHLKEIYQTYNREGKNPFLLYVMDKYEEITDSTKVDGVQYGIKASNKETSPYVVGLRYYTSISSPYFVEKDSIKKKDTTFIAYDEASIAYLSLYRDIEKKQFVFFPVRSIFLDLGTGKVKKDNRYYLQDDKRYLQGKKLQFLTNIYKGNYLEIIKVNHTVVKGYYSTFNKTNDYVELDNRNHFSKSDLQVTVVHTDYLGDIKKRLTFKSY